MSETSHAIYSGDVEKLRSLKDAGGDAFVKQRTPKEGWNLLHKALLRLATPTPIESIKYLLEIGVDVADQDCYGNTPLHYAAEAKYVEAMRLLLDYGAPMDGENIDSETPLLKTLASLPLSIPATELLLSRGAHITPVTRRHVHAISHGENEGLEELFDRYAKGKDRGG